MLSVLQLRQVTKKYAQLQYIPRTKSTVSRAELADRFFMSLGLTADLMWLLLGKPE